MSPTERPERSSSARPRRGARRAQAEVANEASADELTHPDVDLALGRDVASEGDDSDASGAVDDGSDVDLIAALESADPEFADAALGTPSQWSGWLVTLGLALITLEALAMLLTIAQGLSLHRTGAGSFNGDLLHRLGIAASRSLGVAQSLTVVVGVVLVSLPTAIGRPPSRRYEGRRTLALYGAIAVAVLIGIGTALGVRAELHLDRLQQQSTTPFRRWALATDVVGTLGVALVAFLGALAALPDRRGQANGQLASAARAGEEAGGTSGPSAGAGTGMDTGDIA